MLTTKDRFVAELKAMIRDEYIRIRDNVATGSAQDYNQYQKQVGLIQGLSTALEFIDEAEAVANGTKTRGEN